MKNYELIIEQRQPACEQEVTHNGLWVKYEFTED